MSREESRPKQTLRLTAGFLRGREIATPGGKTHPMGARERLALLNSLGEVCGLRVLDAFAGSGALGFELLSRGAKSVTFVELSPVATRVIRENAERLGVSERCEICTADVSAFQSQTLYDLIVADPPYDDFFSEKIGALAKWLHPDGTLVLSHPTDEAPALPGLSCQKTRKYARARISFYAK